MQQPDALQARRVLLAQLVLALVMAAAAAPYGPSVTLSVLVGSAACFLATVVFAFWVFRSCRPQAPALLLMRFYGAETAKLAMVLGLLATAFANIEGLNLPVLLGAYFAVQVLPAIIASEWDPGPKRER